VAFRAAEFEYGGVITDKCNPMARIDGAGTEPALFKTHYKE